MYDYGFAIFFKPTSKGLGLESKLFLVDETCQKDYTYYEFSKFKNQDKQKTSPFLFECFL